MNKFEELLESTVYDMHMKRIMSYGKQLYKEFIRRMAKAARLQKVSINSMRIKDFIFLYNELLRLNYLAPVSEDEPCLRQYDDMDTGLIFVQIEVFGYTAFFISNTINSDDVLEAFTKDAILADDNPNCNWGGILILFSHTMSAKNFHCRKYTNSAFIKDTCDLAMSGHNVDIFIHPAKFDELTAETIPDDALDEDKKEKPFYKLSRLITSERKVEVPDIEKKQSTSIANIITAYTASSCYCDMITLKKMQLRDFIIAEDSVSREPYKTSVTKSSNYYQLAFHGADSIYVFIYFHTAGVRDIFNNLFNSGNGTNEIIYAIDSGKAMNPTGLLLIIPRKYYNSGIDPFNCNLIEQYPPLSDILNIAYEYHDMIYPIPVEEFKSWKREEEKESTEEQANKTES